MNAQILIKCGDCWFEFSKSRTGQLDYEGKRKDGNLPEIEGYQEIASSAYFTPSWYTYLQTELNSNPKVYVSPDVDVSDMDVFGFLVHIGPILSAVEARDSLLAGELYLRRKYCFENFAPLVQYIEAKISGNQGLEKAGYIRALAAKVIREAKLEKMSYDGKLCRVSHSEIVVKMTV